MHPEGKPGLAYNHISSTPRRPGAGGEFSFCDYLCFFLFSKPSVPVKDDLKPESFGGVLAAYPSCLEFCLKKKEKKRKERKEREAIITQYCGESGSKSMAGRVLTGVLRMGKSPQGMHSTGGPCWGLVFIKCDHRAGQRKFSRNAQVCLDFIQDSHSPLGLLRA